MYFDINGLFHLEPTSSVPGSREQAFVYALASASLTQSIAKSCSLGFSTKCSCGRLPNTPPPGEFKWGGCGDDLRYGVLFSRWFADGVFLKRKKKSKKVLMSLHNNRAGRKVGQGQLMSEQDFWLSLFLIPVICFWGRVVVPCG